MRSLFIVIIFFSFIALSRSDKCVKWGNVFDVPLEGNNIPLACTLPTGKPVCCEATDDISTFGSTSRGVGNLYANLIEDGAKSASSNPESCVIAKSYHSSPQEVRDFEFSVKLQKIQDFQERFTRLMDYVTSDEVVANSTRWLSRVTYHMQHHSISKVEGKHHEDDMEFMSYFKITKSCSDSGVTSWLEFIEPITLTARHPFGFGRCRPSHAYFKAKNEASPAGGIGRKRVSVGRSNVDYVLLQSGVNIHHHSHDSQGNLQRTTSTVIHRSSDYNHFNSSIFTSAYTPTKTVVSDSRSPMYFMLDSGTSTFDSSLVWFTCAYSQVKLF
jgi:hypothetical protein